MTNPKYNLAENFRKLEEVLSNYSFEVAQREGISVEDAKKNLMAEIFGSGYEGTEYISVTDRDTGQLVKLKWPSEIGFFGLLREGRKE